MACQSFFQRQSDAKLSQHWTSKQWKCLLQLPLGFIFYCDGWETFTCEHILKFSILEKCIFSYPSIVKFRFYWGSSENFFSPEWKSTQKNIRTNIRILSSIRICTTSLGNYKGYKLGHRKSTKRKLCNRRR